MPAALLLMMMAADPQVRVTAGACPKLTRGKIAAPDDAAQPAGDRVGQKTLDDALASMLDGQPLTVDFAREAFNQDLSCVGSLALLAALMRLDRTAAEAVLRSANPSDGCLNEVRAARRESDFRTWLHRFGLDERVPSGAVVLSVRHALYLAGRVIAVQGELSAQPPVRPVHGLSLLASLAPELRGGVYSGEFGPLRGNMLKKGTRSADCEVDVPLTASVAGRCAVMRVRALACHGDMMGPYVVEQTRLLNAMLDAIGSERRFALSDNLDVLFGNRAGLEEALSRGLLLNTTLTPNLDEGEAWR